MKIGDINIHVPADQAVFQADFDFSGSKGFILRVSAGVDPQTRVATWLIQAIDPDTGEVLHDPKRGLLLPDSNGAAGRGSVSYTVRALNSAATGATIEAQARVFLDDSPPIESEGISHTLDASAPTTALTVRSAGNDATGAPTYDVTWRASDDASGVKIVTVYVAENGGDFRIWQRQVAGAQGQAVFTGVAGKTYEFLAAATDNAGNREAAAVVNAVLPDDGSQQAAQQALGANDTVSTTAELPAASTDRTYPSSDLFQQATLRLPGFVAPAQPGDLQSVLAPMTVRGFASGFSGSEGDIGALAMVELADGSILASAGELRNEVFRFDKLGGRSTTPLFTLDSPVLDMAVDALGQLWVMTGSELLLVDASSGAVIERHLGPADDPLTHAVAIDPESGRLYVSSGNGIEIFDPNAADPAQAWKHFSNTRVGDLAFGPDGRLWGVRWTGSDMPGGKPDESTEIISFPMTGRSAGRAEVEYRIAGMVDSIAFGRAGSPLAGVLVASSDLAQRPVVVGADAVRAAQRQRLDGRARLAPRAAAGPGRHARREHPDHRRRPHPGRRDELDRRDRAGQGAEGAEPRASATARSMPLPLVQVAITFDQAMWTGRTATMRAICIERAEPRQLPAGCHRGRFSDLGYCSRSRCAGTPARARPS